MKKIFLLLSVIILGLIIIFLKNSNDVENTNKEELSIKEIIVSIDTNCEFDKTFYTEGKNNKFYTSCLNEIKIQLSDNKLFELNEVLNDNDIDLNDLIKSSNEKIILENSILYQIDNLAFLVCENNEVIFGGYDSLEKNDYCEVGIDESV